MVAYNFKKVFAPDVESLVKRQTVRPDRKRHALTNEPVQLYTGMRSRHCRKLVSPDPICIRNAHVAIELPHTSAAFTLLRPVHFELDGIALDGDEIEQFARADGFGRVEAKIDGAWRKAAQVGAAALFGSFLYAAYGKQLFEGRAIFWEPQDNSPHLWTGAPVDGAPWYDATAYGDPWCPWCNQPLPASCNDGPGPHHCPSCGKTYLAWLEDKRRGVIRDV